MEHDQRRVARMIGSTAVSVFLLLALHAALIATAPSLGLLLACAGAVAALGLRVDVRDIRTARLRLILGAALGASLALMSLGAASVGTGIGLLPAIAALIASAALACSVRLLAPDR